jgi:hypothetical protein
MLLAVAIDAKTKTILIVEVSLCTHYPMTHPTTYISANRAFHRRRRRHPSRSFITNERRHHEEGIISGRLFALGQYRMGVYHSYYSASFYCCGKK